MNMTTSWSIVDGTGGCSFTTQNQVRVKSSVLVPRLHTNSLRRPFAIQSPIQPHHYIESKRSQRLITQAATQEPTTAATLESLELYPIVNVQGFIQPKIPEDAQATVFAVYDQSKTLQYVGFSKDLRNSLRTVFSRRPDKAHYFRAYFLNDLDQKAMLDVRTAWFAENSGPPPGNALAGERTAWQEPPSSFSISDRGKVQAAEELAKQIQNQIRLRGCKEVFEVDEEYLQKGQVEFLAAAAMSAEDLEAQKAAQVAAEQATRKCSVEIDNEVIPFQLFIRRDFKTNGGHMYDITVTCQDKESEHRIIVGKQYYEEQGITPDVVLERIVAFLLRRKVPRQTEGMLLSSDFPSNYFSVSEVEQFFAEDFEKELGEARGGFWRFNRTEDYGYKGANESGAQLSSQFAKGWQVDAEK